MQTIPGLVEPRFTIFEPPMDVIITSPLSSQLTIQNASIQGRAAVAAERIKNAKFQEDSSAANMLFLPFTKENPTVSFLLN